MSKTYKMIEVVGASPVSFAEAVKAAVAEAAKTIRSMSWFEVSGFSGRVAGGKVAEFQAKVKIGFELEGSGK
ncbi:MAG: dodecin family protein [Candidatus Aureabacteria bacterium]|nr:dodecin family protein [Candidatus Auribacterota bacterium]